LLPPPLAGFAVQVQLFRFRFDAEIIKIRETYTKSWEKETDLTASNNKRQVIY